MINIKKSDARISAWGMQGDVKTIYWASLPELPRRSKPLNLVPATIIARFYDGTEANVTAYCTFDPVNGSIVPATATNVTVTAYYVAKSGKTLKASVTLPVVYPFGLRVITDSEYKPKENYFETSSPLWDEERMPFDKTTLSTYCLWARENSDDIVSATLIENPSYTISPILVDLFGHYYGITAKKNQKQDVSVYHNLQNSPSIESFDYAIEITATATVEGTEFTSGTTYVESIPIDYFVLKNLPTSYSQSGLSYIFEKSNIQFKYKNGTTATPKAGLSDLFLYFSYVEPTAINVRDSLTINFVDGLEGVLYVARENPRALEARYEFTAYRYKCQNGYIDWTREDAD